jgi:nucleoside-diphosphate kinase
MNYTFSLIKPGSVCQAAKILFRIDEKGFKLASIKTLYLTRNQVETFYAEHRERSFFEALCAPFVQGPVVAFIVKGHCGNVPAAFREFLGATNPADAAPGTLRKEFGVNLDNNAVHGSDSNESAEREARLFFSGFEYLNACASQTSCAVKAS